MIIIENENFKFISHYAGNWFLYPICVPTYSVLKLFWLNLKVYPI